MCQQTVFGQKYNSNALPIHKILFSAISGCYELVKVWLFPKVKTLLKINYLNYLKPLKQKKTNKGCTKMSQNTIPINRTYKQDVALKN